MLTQSYIIAEYPVSAFSFLDINFAFSVGLVYTIVAPIGCSVVDPGTGIAIYTSANADSTDGTYFTKTFTATRSDLQLNNGNVPAPSIVIQTIGWSLPLTFPANSVSVTN